MFEKRTNYWLRKTRINIEEKEDKYTREKEERNNV